MKVRQLAALILSDDERAELTMRRKTARVLALRARIVLACAEGGQNKEVAAQLGLDRSTQANGVGVLCHSALQLQFIVKLTYLNSPTARW